LTGNELLAALTAKLPEEATEAADALDNRRARI
jgi:hypothetical protein